MGRISKADWGRVRRKLRKCQREAVDAIGSFLRTKPKGRSFLACLPTGAGKSGIIAVVAHQSSHQRVLVISPRRAVCNQLVKELSGDFFQRLLTESMDGLKAVRHLASDWKDPGIYVATFQKLATLSDADIARLRRDFGLVMVDEGHSEPAPVWSKIARGLQGHKVVITATPYRNDLFQFDVHPEHNYVYSFRAAEADNVLVRPGFESVVDANVETRVRALLAGQPGTKCIVKCRSRDEVELWRGRFKAAGLNVLAIHEGFRTRAADGIYAYVPKSLNRISCDVIVHQRKLDEGIDLPEAKVLVITYAVSSGRELVQTVGRIVRVNGGAKAHVLDASKGSNEALWSNYRAFDAYISKPSAWSLFIRSLHTPRLLSDYLKTFPERGYYDRAFKERFDLDSFDPKKGLEVPLASLCFIEKSSAYSTPKFCDALFWRLHKQGELVKHYQNQDGFDVLVSIRFDNSKFLSNSLFFQPCLEVILVKELEGRIAVFDSRGGSYANDEDLGTLGAVQVESLLNLARRGDRVRTREAQAVAVGTTRYRAERIAMKGGDLESVAAPQSNASYALSTVRVDNLNGHGDPDSSYYLGVGAGRVSDQRLRGLTLAELNAWVQDVSGAMDVHGTVGSQLLRSYATPANVVPATNPIALVFDLTSLESTTEVWLDGVPVALPAGFVYATTDAGVFSLVGIPITASYSPVKRKMDLATARDARFHDGTSFIEWLNIQPFKALFDDGVSYSEGRFYRVSLPTELGIDVSTAKLGGCLIGVDELQTRVRNEKGAYRRGLDKYFNTTRDSFDPESVFALLDGLRLAAAPGESVGLTALRNVVAGCDLVLCADMGTEVADFIISSPSKLCFVHVKCGEVGAPESSAGSLAEVGGQAMKNLEHLVSKSELLAPGNRASLSGAWPSNADRFKLEHRVRLFRGMQADAYIAANHLASKEALFEEVWRTVLDRRTSDACEKEVWLVVGRAFSRRHFVDQMALGGGATSESLQAYQLLDGWLGLTSSLDVRLRIFTSP